MTEALVVLGLAFGLTFLRVPVAFSMLISGFAGFAIHIGVDPAMAMVARTTYDTALTYTFSALPLFILMGAFVNRAGISDDMFRAANAMLGHKPGGLAMGTILASGGLAAVSGSSLATAATLANVALPQMRKYGYSDALATGSIAAGGTLGILIPPSIVMVIYGLLTQTDIGALFIAGIIPGAIGVVGYLLAVALVVKFSPESGPAGPRTPWGQRFREVLKIWHILLLFTLVMGGIYGGIFTATEAAGMGSLGAFLLAVGRGRIKLRGLVEACVETTTTTCSLFIVITGALCLSNYISVIGLPQLLGTWLSALQMPGLAVILVILLVYLVLGCFLESISMILLTVPIFFPVVTALGYDPVWFGIIVVVMTEISLITPPVGMNVFVLHSTAPDVPMNTIFRGVSSFLAADVVRVLLLVLFPAIVLFLPRLISQ